VKDTTEHLWKKAGYNVMKKKKLWRSLFCFSNMIWRL